MDALRINEMLLGAVAACCFVAGLFFLRFATRSKERLFFFFALSFFIEGFSRIQMGLAASWSEDTAPTYVLRLVSYGLIFFAIWDKNRPPRR